MAEEGYLLNMSVRQIQTLLGRAAGLVDAEGKARPMAAKTTFKYLQRVRERHAANPLPGLDEARAQAARRCMQMLTRLRADGGQRPGEVSGSVKHAKTILAYEARYDALMGLDAPRDKEAIEAQAQAIVDKLLAKARQERAAAQAQADYQIEEERRRQWEAEEQEQRRMIDVGPASGNGDQT